MLKGRELRIIIVIIVVLTMFYLQFSSQVYASPSATVGNGFLKTSGTWIVDSSGRKVFLRGANFRGYESGDPSTWGDAHTEKDYQNFKSWGFNVVRLPISWGSMERTQGSIDQDYFSKYVDRDVKWAKKSGLYIILDMHQWYWNRKWSGGNGAPDWAVSQYPSTESGRIQAMEDFWKRPELESSFEAAWKYVAARYANETTIAGYDILNEPWQMFGPNSATSLADRWGIIEGFYEKVIDDIRPVDSNHIIFVEAHNAYFVRPINRPNIVWSPHFYYYVYEYYGKPYYHANSTLLKNYLDGFYNKFVLQFNQPMWIGEFGMEKRVPGSDTWTHDTIEIFSGYQLGWTWWTYWKSDNPGFELANYDGTGKLYFLQYLANPALTG